MSPFTKYVRLSLVLAAVVVVPLVASIAFGFTPSGLLEIHHINVQQGDCTLIIGPNGTTFMIDAGAEGKGTAEVVPYLQNKVGLLPADGIDYMLASHRHTDHLGGLDEVINAGYDVHLEAWDNGSNYSVTAVTNYLNAAATTTAGPVTEIPLGTVVQLGDGATATAVTVDGNVLGYGTVSGATNDENDRSVAILIKYRNFEYLTAGDMGGGQTDNACTGRTTSQVNIETPLATSLMPGGGAALLTSDGVEVLHVNHHGSESSMNSDYMNQLSPRVAVILVGAGQGSGYYHPRIDVVEKVLLAQGTCITADPALVLQTEEGNPTGSTTSYAGYCCGDVVIKTSGLANYTITGTGEVSQGPDERSAAGLPATIDVDGGGVPDTEPPVVAVVAPNGGETWAAGSSQSITWNATDNVGVTSISLYYSVAGASGPFTAIATGEANDGIYSWTVPSDPSGNAFVKAVAFDAAGNSSEDVSNAAFAITIPPVADFAGAPVSGCVPLTVSFTDQSTGNITTWDWDFGDASAHSSAQNPSHQYASAGDYTVALTVTGPTGSDIETKTAYIHTTGAPLAAFVGNPVSGYAPLTVQFTDQSTGSAVSWAWDFGDGGTSALQSPSHVYQTAGTYTVILTAANSCGSDPEVKVSYVTVNEAPAQQCDDFADGSITDWGNKTGTWTATGGYMKGNSSTVAAKTTSPFGSYGVCTVDCDVRMNSGQNQRKVRVIFAYVDANNYRFIEGDDATNRWRIYDRVGGTETYRKSVNRTIATATWYHVQVTQATDGTVTMYVGGVNLGYYKFASAVTGLVGCGYNRSNCDFDNFCVKSSVGALALAEDPIDAVMDDPTVSAELRSNYPDPFSGTTTIAFSVSGAARVRLVVYNVAGQVVAALIDRTVEPGLHQVPWDGRASSGESVAAGVYFYRLTVNDKMAFTRKMVLMQ